MQKIINTTAGAILLTASVSYAAVSYTGTAINEDFTGYDGLSAPAGWDVVDAGPANGSSTGGNGNPTGPGSLAGIYAMDVGGGNVALGVQPADNVFTPGYFQLEVTNNSGATVTDWNVRFTSYQYNDWDRANSFNFSYSLDGTAFTPVPSGSFTSDDLASPFPPFEWAVSVNYDDTISATVADGASLYLRWTGDDVSGTGSRDEFALDDVFVDAVPEPSSTALIGVAGLALLLRRRNS